MTRRRVYMKETGQWVPSVWCSLHDQHPNDCFDLHHPETVFRVDTRMENWRRWLAQAWARIDSEVRGETTEAGADPPVTGERDGMDPTDGGGAGHGDEMV